MKSLMLLFFFIIGFPIKTYAIGYPTFISKIAGVTIWRPESDEGVEDENYEFIKYCNGKNRIYILENKNKSFICKTVKESVKSNIYRIKIIGNNNMPYTKLTISNKEFSIGKYKVSQLSDKEFIAIKPMIKDRFDLLMKENENYMKEYMGAKSSSFFKSEYDKHIKNISSDKFYFNNYNYKKSISVNNINIILSIIGVELNGLGWNFRYGVFEKMKDSYKFIGEINGCIDSVADLDKNDIPEIGTILCENSEGTSDSYWSIFPQVKEVVNRSQ